MNYKYGINITTYNRFEFLSQTLNSLSNTNFLPNTIISITDDHSRDINVIDYINNFNIENVKINKYFNPENIGSKKNYVNSLLKFKDEDVDFIVNIDSDCLLNKDWLIKINEIINIFGDNIICSSFSCRYHIGNPGNKLVEIKDFFYERDTLNGMGVCFPKKLIYDFTDNTHMHFDEYLTRYLKEKYNMKCICTKESYMQHIGAYGVHSHPFSYDKSDNFIGV